jgi:hypothetical protein
MAGWADEKPACLHRSARTISYRVSRWFVLPWLLVFAACSNAAGPTHGPPGGSSAPEGGVGTFSENLSPDAGPIDQDADLGLACTDASPGFLAAVVPILTGCAGGELCHGFPSPPSLYGQLVGAPASDGCDAGVLVSPGSVRRSYLLHKVTGIAMCSGTDRMPPGGAMSTKDIQTIADWICSGAPDD